ncbi:MAG TPA: HIT domain-containing protein [Acidimicrobiales bacterium]|nr:HIT domain-containing protein [Acidimicrobiales bacterium]
MSLDRLWAGWRSEYVTNAADDPGCVLCRILSSDEPDEETFVLWRGATVAALLNAFPYTSGHLMVMPVRHTADLADLSPQESSELWSALTDSLSAIRRAYGPDALNLGANLGRAAGAGVPGHVHLHVLPRWQGDTNFMTSVAEARVLPEALPVSWQKLRRVWPS